MSADHQSSEPGPNGVGRALALGLGRGLATFGIFACVCLLLGLGAWGLAFRDLPIDRGLILAWIVLAASHRVGMVFVGPGGSTLIVHVAALTGMFGVVALGVSAGRTLSRPSTSLRLTLAAVIGASLAYGSAVWLVSVFVPSVPVIDVRAVAWEAFVLPFALVLGSSIAGAALGELRGRPATRLRAGWNAFVAAMILAFVGFLIAAALSPSKSAAYLRFVTSGGTHTMVGGAHVLMLPNQSVSILAPAMGGCDLARESSRSLVSLCGLSVDSDSPVLALFGLRPVDQRFPVNYALFLLVPVLATVWAGTSIGGPLKRRIADAAVSGVVFAVLIGFVSALASVSFAGSFLVSHRVTVGPEILLTTLLALAWGVVGEVSGSLLPVRRQEPEVPPSPTSV